MTAGTVTSGLGSAAPAVLARNWGALAVRGAVAVLFGIFAIANPLAVAITFALLFGAFAFVDGVLNIIAGLRQREHGGPWGGLLVVGVLALSAGSLTFWHPIRTFVFLVYVVAAWALVTGVGQIVAAVRLRRELRGEWLLALGGALSVGFGLLLLAAPGAAALAFGVWIGAYALFTGALLLALAFRLRGAARGGVLPAASR